MIVSSFPLIAAVVVMGIFYFTSKRPGIILQIGSIIDNKHVYIRNHEKKQVLIVFCHGFGGQIPLFEYQLERFEKDYSVLAIDYTGHGKSAESDCLDDYTAASFATQVKEAIIAYSTPGQKIVLVGHSYGCMVSIILANQYKDLNIASLILLAPFGFINDNELENFHKSANIQLFFLNSIGNLLIGLEGYTLFQ